MGYYCLENDSPSRGRKRCVDGETFKVCANGLGLENDSPSRGRKPN